MIDRLLQRAADALVALLFWLCDLSDRGIDLTHLTDDEGAA